MHRRDPPEQLPDDRRSSPIRRPLPSAVPQPGMRWRARTHDPLTASDLEYELRNQMRPTDVSLIIAGMYAAHSDWVDFELSFARRIGRAVIGIIKFTRLRRSSANVRPSR